MNEVQIFDPATERRICIKVISNDKEEESWQDFIERLTDILVETYGEDREVVKIGLDSPEYSAVSVSLNKQDIESLAIEIEKLADEYQIKFNSSI